MKRGTRLFLAYIEYKAESLETFGYVPRTFNIWKHTSMVAFRIIRDYAE